MISRATFTKAIVENGQMVSGRQSSRRRKKYFERHFFLIIALDMILLNACLLSCIGMQLAINELMDHYFLPFLCFLGIANLGWLAMAIFSDIYWVFERPSLNLKVGDLINGTILYSGLLSLIYYQFFFSTLEIHFLIPSCLLFFLTSFLLHYSLKPFYIQSRRKIKYAIVGGAPSNIRYFEEVFRSAYGHHHHCAGRFGHAKVPGLSTLGGYDQIEQYILTHDLDQLFYIDSDLNNADLRNIVQLCRSHFIDFEVIPKEINLFKRGLQIEQLGRLPIFRRKQEPLQQFRNKLLKRFFDIVISLLVIVLIFPWLFLLIALLIKIESRGPVFFVQRRSGYWNKPFYMLKFRSMTVNADCDQKQATKGDCRITRVGKFLRKTSLDELPQFINVLKGDMSVVGPRPHMLKHTEDYAKLIKTFMIRHEVKPGITGWAQVSGWRGPTEKLYKMAKRVEYDVEYIENWTLLLDLKCMVFTVLNVFKGEKNAI